MRKFVKAAAIAMAITAALATTAMAAPKMSKKKVSVQLGESVTLKVKGAKGTKVWKSSNPNVASVSSKGKVKAGVAGKATITATVKGKTVKCAVTVKSSGVARSSVSVQAKKSVSVKVTNPMKRKVKVSSSNKKVATVKYSKGKVKITGKKAGKATVTVKIGSVKYKIAASVTAKPSAGKPSGSSSSSRSNGGTSGAWKTPMPSHTINTTGARSVTGAEAANFGPDVYLKPNGDYDLSYAKTEADTWYKHYTLGDVMFSLFGPGIGDVAHLDCTSYKGDMVNMPAGEGSWGANKDVESMNTECMFIQMDRTTGVNVTVNAKINPADVKFEFDRSMVGVFYDPYYPSNGRITFRLYVADGFLGKTGTTTITMRYRGMELKRKVVIEKIHDDTMNQIIIDAYRSGSVKGFDIPSEWIK